jgi:hypothetical protein
MRLYHMRLFIERARRDLSHTARPGKGASVRTPHHLGGESVDRQFSFMRKQFSFRSAMNVRSIQEARGPGMVASVTKRMNSCLSIRFASAN